MELATKDIDLIRANRGALKSVSDIPFTDHRRCARKLAVFSHRSIGDGRNLWGPDGGKSSVLMPNFTRIMSEIVRNLSLKGRSGSL